MAWKPSKRWGGTAASRAASSSSGGGGSAPQPEPKPPTPPWQVTTPTPTPTEIVKFTKAATGEVTEIPVGTTISSRGERGGAVQHDIKLFEAEKGKVVVVGYTDPAKQQSVMLPTPMTQAEFGKTTMGKSSYLIPSTQKPYVPQPLNIPSRGEYGLSVSEKKALEKAKASEQNKLKQFFIGFANPLSSLPRQEVSPYEPILTEKQRAIRTFGSAIGAPFIVLTSTGPMAGVIPTVKIAAATTKAGQAIKATKAGQKVIQFAEITSKSSIGKTIVSTSQAIKATKLGKITTTPVLGRLTLANIGTSYGVTRGVQVSTEAVSRYKGYTPEEKILIGQTPDYFKQYGQAKASEREQIQGWVRNIASQVPIIDIYAGNLAAYRVKAVELGKSRGYKGEKLTTFVSAMEKQRRFSSYGQAAGLLALSTYTEIGGGQAVAKAFQKNAAKIIEPGKVTKELFKISGRAIGPWGFIEGTTQEIVQQQAERTPVQWLPGKTPEGRITFGRTGNIAAMGVFGYGSAFLLGGAIVATQVSKKGVSKVLQTGGYLSDVYELPGDLLAKGRSRLMKNLLGIEYPEPTIFKSKVPVFSIDPSQIGFSKTSPVFTFNVAPAGSVSLGTTTPETIFVPKAKAAAKAKTFSFFPSSKKGTVIPTLANVQSKSQTQVQNRIQENLKTLTNTQANILTKAQSQTQITIPVITPVQTPAIVPTIINIPAFVPTPTTTPTDTFINTPALTDTFVNINTQTPVFRLPPPIPLDFGMSVPSGYGASRKGKKKKYINELEAGRNLLKELGLFGTMPKAKPKPISKITTITIKGDKVSIKSKKPKEKTKKTKGFNFMGEIGFNKFFKQPKTKRR